MIKLKSNHHSSPLTENLRILFKNKQLSISETAHKLGIPIMTIRRLLSGETMDPRISTLKLMANHFNVTVDCLLKDDLSSLAETCTKSKPVFVPILDWELLEATPDVQQINLREWSNWQPIVLSNPEAMSNHTFALPSRPFMYPQFPHDTMFIIDPTLTPKDDDLVLVRMRKTQALTLRKLFIDPPQWHLHPTTLESKPLQYSNEDHIICGVTLLTMLYKR